MNLGKMELVLSANLAAYTAAFQSAGKKLDEFNRAGEKTQKETDKRTSSMAKGFSFVRGAIVAAAAAVATGKLVHSLDDAAETVDRLGKAGKRLGIGVEFLSALRFAADEAGVEFETLAKAAGKAGKNVAIMAAGGDNVLRLGAYNVALRDEAGKLRDIAELLPEIAAGVESVTNPGEQLALTEKIFGRAGGEAFLSLLKDSGSFMQNLTEQTERARRLGNIFTDDQVTKLTAYNDAVGRIGAAWLGLRVQVMTKVAPFLTDMANRAAGALAAVPEMVQNTLRIFENGEVGQAARDNLATLGIAIKKTLYDSIVKGGMFAIDTLSTYAGARISLAFDFANPFGAKDARSMAEKLQEKIGQIDPEYGTRWDQYVKMLSADIEDLGYSFNALTGAADLLKAHEVGNIVTDPKKARTASEQVSELTTRVRTFAADASKGIYGFASNLSDAFTEATFGAKLSFSEIAISFGKMLESMALKVLFFEPILRQVGIGFSALLGGRTDPGPTGVGQNTAGGYGVSDVSAARGGIWGGGRLTAFAAGFIASTPTYFPMAGGGTGEIGERGKEGVLPLAPTPHGLGVYAMGGGGVEINIIDQRSSGERPRVTESTGSDGRRRVQVLIVDAVNQGVADGSFDRTLGSAFGVSRRGS